MRLQLPKKSHHPVVDDNLTHLYHLPVIRSFFIKRLTMTLDLLESKTFDKTLEIGFGSGVLFHEESRFSQKLFGCDMHDHIPEVKSMSRHEKLNIHLNKGNIVQLPYKNESFDCVISIATLEHILELKEAISEIKRVLKKGGVAALGFPVETKLTDFLLVAAGTTKAYRQKLREVHPNSHTAILNEVQSQFGNIHIRKLPNFTPEILSLYCSCLATKES